jgi:hypothetical protein
MPRPHKPSAYEIELTRKIDSLQIRLLELNATLRLKVLYAERLEFLLHQRNQRVDQLFARLEQACTVNRHLEAECEHLAGIIANDHPSQTHIERRLEAP